MGSPVRERKSGPLPIALQVRLAHFCTYTPITNTGRWKKCLDQKFWLLMTAEQLEMP